MVNAARKGDGEGVALAARCLLALRGITHPTREQRAGAILEAWHMEDIRVMAHGKHYKD